jgi:acylpyruvate hydrolase
MKFTTFHKNGQDRLGLIDGDQVIDLNQCQPQVNADLRLALK